MKLELKSRNIPLNEKGDPAFTDLGIPQEQIDYTFKEYLGSESVLAVFTVDEVTELVNRALYQILYQKTAHRKRGAEERERLAPVKQKVKELFGVSWLKATPGQIQAATDAVMKDRKKG